MEDASTNFRALDRDPALVIANDSVDDREAQACPFALLLACEEGLKELGHVFLGNAVSLIVHRDHDEAPRLCIRAGRRRGVALLHNHADKTALFHRLKGVHQEVREDLEQLLRVGVDASHRALSLDHHLHPRLAGEWRKGEPRRFRELHQIDNAPLSAPPREVEQATHDLRHAMRLLQHRTRAVSNIMRCGGVFLHDAGVPGDDVEGCPELMRELRSELTDRAQSVRVTQLFEGLRALHIALIECLARILQLRRHVIHLAGELGHFTVPRDHLAGCEIATGDAAREVAQALDGLSDEPTRERERDDAGQHRQGERLQCQRPPSDATQERSHRLRFGELDRDHLMTTLDRDVRDDLILVHAHDDITGDETPIDIRQARTRHALHTRRDQARHDMRAGNFLAAQHRLRFMQRVGRSVIAREGGLNGMRKEASVTQRRLKKELLLLTHAHRDTDAEDKNDRREQREPKSDSDPHGRTLHLNVRDSNATKAEGVNRRGRISNRVG